MSEINVIIQQATNKLDIVIQPLINQNPIEIAMTKPGPQGEIGLTGETGLTGLTGADGYTPIKDIDYFDGAKGDKGDTGNQGIQGIQGEAGMDAFVPLGMKAFNVYGDSFYYNEIPLKDEYQIQGDFTYVKRFNARVSAVASSFIMVNNTIGDKIEIINMGYTFSIKIYKAGVSIHTYTEASSILFPSLGDIVQFIEVDYTRNQIRFSRDSVDTRVFDIPELSQLKESIFTKADLGINSYQNCCMYSFIMCDCIPASNSQFLLDPLKELPLTYVVNTTTKNILISTPNKWFKRTFTNHQITLTEADLANESIATNNYMNHELNAVIGTYTLKQDKLFYYSYSLDVTGLFTFRGTTTASNIIFRAEEKDTGVIIEQRVLSSTNIDIPTGRWKISIYALVFSRYNTYAFNLLIGYGGISTGGEITVYDDAILHPIAIAFSAMPKNTNYERGYCPFTKQYALGNYSLSDTYR